MFDENRTHPFADITHRICLCDKVFIDLTERLAHIVGLCRIILAVIGKRYAVGKRLFVHSCKVRRAEPIYRRFNARTMLISLAFFAQELSVGNVHCKHGRKIAACASADCSDSVGNNAVFCRILFQETYCVSAIENSRREDCFVAQTIVDRRERIPFLNSVQKFFNVSVALIAYRKSAAVNMYKQRERTLALVGQKNIPRLRR